MERIDWHCSAADWLIEYPYLLPLFEELGIDYCCGGRSLQSACDKAAVDPQYFLQRTVALEAIHTSRNPSA